MFIDPDTAKNLELVQNAVNPMSKIHLLGMAFVYADLGSWLNYSCRDHEPHANQDGISNVESQRAPTTYE
jgi:hypothetical protein